MTSEITRGSEKWQNSQPLNKQTLSATPPAAGGFTHQVLTRTLTIIVWEKYYKSRWNRVVLWSDARMLGSMYRVNAGKYPQRV